MRKRQRAFTLIETLLSILIAVVVLGMAYTLLRSWQNTETFQERESEHQAMIMTMTEIMRGLETASPAINTNWRFRLSQVGNFSQLSFPKLSALPENEQGLGALQYVTYLVDTKTNLLSITEDETPPYTTQTNIALEKVRLFSVWVDDNEPQIETSKADEWPKTATIVLGLGGEEGALVSTGEVFFLQQLVATSRLERVTNQ